MVLFLLLPLALIAVFPGRDMPAYDSLCKAECLCLKSPAAGPYDAASGMSPQ